MPTQLLLSQGRCAQILHTKRTLNYQYTSRFLFFVVPIFSSSLLHHPPYQRHHYYLLSTVSSYQNASKDDATDSFRSAPQSDLALISTFSGPAACFEPPAPFLRPTPYLFLKTLVESESIEGFLALLQKLIANPENPKATTSVERSPTPAQKQGIKMNFQIAIRRRNVRLIRNSSELHRMEKSSQTGSNHLSNSQKCSFCMDRERFCACRSCYKFFSRRQPSTPQIKIDCKMQKNSSMPPLQKPYLGVRTVLFKRFSAGFYFRINTSS